MFSVSPGLGIQWVLSEDLLNDGEPSSRLFAVSVKSLGFSEPPCPILQMGN